MKARRVTSRFASSEGQTLVEFALVIFLLLAVLFGVFELSRMILVYTTIANATRAGVRWAIVRGKDSSSPATNAQVQTYVENLLKGGTLNTASMTPPQVTGAGNAAGSTVTVTVSYAYDSWVSFFALSPTFTSTSQGVITF